MKEVNFEDTFFDDLIGLLFECRRPYIENEYDKAWNASLQNVFYAVGSFFGHDIPSRYAMPDDEKLFELRPLMHDIVHHPGYYCSGGIEVLDYILAKNMDFMLGQVCKYISRAGKKNPVKEIEDLEKAKFYLDKKIELLKRERIKND